MAKRKSKPSPFASQVAAEALIRFNPELTGLKELQRDAKSTFGSRVRAGTATSSALQSVIDAAVPDVRQAYSDGATGIGDVNALVHGDVAGLQGAGAERFRNAITTETANFANLLKGARANALTDLERRKVSAAAGAKFSADQAGSDLAQALEKIGLRRTEIGKESGAFQQQRVGELAQDQTKREFTARQNRLNRQNQRSIARGHDSTSRQNARTRASSSGGATLPGGAKLQSTSAHASLLDRLDTVKAMTDALAAQGVKRSTSARQLLAGVRGGTVHDPATGAVQYGKDGLPRVAAAIKPQSKLLTSVALDLSYTGHVSPTTARELYRRGYSLKGLGLPGRHGTQLPVQKPPTAKQLADKLNGLPPGRRTLSLP